jgi:CspA family cold shock protein
MTIEEIDLPTLQGKVKWFDPSKGFGFIVVEGFQADILLHANVLRNFGQSSVADGSGISVRVQKTDRGSQAIEVVTIEPPESASMALFELTGEGEDVDLSTLPMEPARIKWFDKGKGFGFANVFGKPEDVFVHVEVLRQSSFADLQAGEAVCLKIADGRRGRMVVQVLPWDIILRVGQSGSQ